MKILLLGAQGQVGFELQHALASLGEVIICDRATLDLENLIQLEAFVRSNKPDFIVNAAAYTHVDKAEEETRVAQQINQDVPQVLAQVAQDLDCWLIQYSTDYVFDGNKKTPYEEDDEINPINIYGKTKAGGEIAIRSLGCKHLILRTSWVYAARGRNFPKTILNLAQQRETLNIIHDQIGAPTSAELIADVTAKILYRLQWDPIFKNFHGGTFHLVAQGSLSWYEFARYLITNAIQKGALFKVTPDKIAPITHAEYPTPARRPINSVLSTQKLSTLFGIKLPHWQVHVDRLLSQLY